MRLTTCPPRPTLERFLRGELPEQETVALEQHLLHCAGCLGRIKALGQNTDTHVSAAWKGEATLPPGEEPGGDEPSLTAFLEPPTAAGELGWLGGYRILQVLGRGGMGVVFRAEDARLKRTVALKVMLPTLSGDPDLGKRFLREAQAMAAVEHDHVVRIYQVGEDRGVPFLAMEFLRGEPLSERLKRDRLLPPAEVLRVGREIALALAAAHATGLIHRDIKPGNVWLEERTPPRVKVLDFGLARAAGQDTHLTRQGAIVGTPGYMAPEQAQGRAVDHRADLFSLGAMLYQLSCGRQPFQGPDMISTLMLVTMHQPDAPAKLNARVPPALSDLVMRLLEKEPARRPGSASMVAEMLRNLEEQPARTTDSTTEATAYVAAPTARRPRRRWPWVAAGLMLLGIIAASAALITIKTPQGDYVVETDDPDFAFQVNNGQVTLEDRKTNRKYNLKAVPKDKAKGEYELDVTEADGLSFKTKTLTIKRGDTVALKAWLERKAEPAPVQRAAAGEDAWLKQVAGMPPDEQVKAVVARLQALNPKYDGALPTNIEGGVVIRLTLLTDNVTDISPLRALTGLQDVNLSASAPGKGQLADLSPLKGLKLTALACSSTAVADLSPLKGMALTYLNCGNSEVSDLSPLKGMPLTQLKVHVTKVADLAALQGIKLTTFDCYQTPVSSLGPLQGMPLKFLNCGSTQVEDLSPVKGMPLTELYCFSNKVSDLTPLKGMKLTLLNVEDTRVTSLAPLAGMPLQTLSVYGTAVSDLAPLKGMRLSDFNCEQSQVTELAPLKGMPLTVLLCDRNNISDLSPLKGMPLTRLNCHTTKVADLSPLEGMALTYLDLFSTPVSSLAPLKGMPLSSLNVGASNVADLSPLKGMPLRDLYCFNTKVSDISALQNMKLVRLNCAGAQVTDLSPVRGMPLEWITCDFKPERDAQLLRSLTTLQSINDKPAKEFWKDVYEK
jgi:serine/threonine protein kinase/Leucine-rich repeat (LRR) protein